MNEMSKKKEIEIPKFMYEKAIKENKMIINNVKYRSYILSKLDEDNQKIEIKDYDNLEEDEIKYVNRKINFINNIIGRFINFTFTCSVLLLLTVSFYYFGQMENSINPQTRAYTSIFQATFSLIFYCLIRNEVKSFLNRKKRK